MQGNEKQDDPVVQEVQWDIAGSSIMIQALASGQILVNGDQVSPRQDGECN